VSNWTEAKNNRRCDLIDKEVAGVISESESAKLEQLQSEMLAYRRKVALLPLNEFLKLYKEIGL